MKLVRLGNLNAEKPAVLVNGHYLDVSAYFHDFNEDFNAKSFRSILKDTLKFDYFKFKSNINHNQIKITEEDLFNLKEYIYNSSLRSSSSSFKN